MEDWITFHLKKLVNLIWISLQKLHEFSIKFVFKTLDEMLLCFIVSKYEEFWNFYLIFAFHVSSIALMYSFKSSQLTLKWWRFLMLNAVEKSELLNLNCEDFWITFLNVCWISIFTRSVENCLELSVRWKSREKVIRDAFLSCDPFYTLT